MQAPPGNGGAESAQNKRNSLPIDSVFGLSLQASSFPEVLPPRKAVGPVTACASLALTPAVEDRHGDMAGVVAWGRDPLKWWLRRGDQTSILGALSAQCRERLAEHLHRLGSRPCLEALIEVADGADLDGVLTRYSRLDPDIVKALRGDRFPPLPIYAVST